MMPVRYAAPPPRRRTPFAAASAPLLVALLAGLAAGGVLGWALMGTAHAVMETRLAPVDAAGGSAKAAQATAAAVAVVVAGAAAADAGDGGAAGKPVRWPIHTLCPSNGSPYQNYQMRIAYATYKLMAAAKGGERHVAFTRILHRAADDFLSQEVPTWRADPLHPECDDWCPYPVADRAAAVVAFLDAARADPSMITAPLIYMVESDYVFMAPLDLPPKGEGAHAGKGWAFPFDYIAPAKHPAEMAAIGATAPLKDLPNTGPAPVLLLRADWEALAPRWAERAAAVEAAPAVVEKLGWVREMYGFAAAVGEAGIKLELEPPPGSRLIAQLPVDRGLGAAHAFHYTQCTIYKEAAGPPGDAQPWAWSYDKRFYTSERNATRVPRIAPPPAFEEGRYRFIEGPPVTAGVHAAIEAMVARMNEGIATLPDLG